MKRCKICGQMCDDNVKFCPACGNKEFMEERQADGNAPHNVTEGINAQQGARQAVNAADTYAGQNTNTSQVTDQGSYNYGNPGSGYQTAGNQPMTKGQFYKMCVPQKLKSDLTVGYVILLLNIVVFAFMGIWYEEPMRFIDVGMLLFIYIGLLVTKHVAFAVLDAVYFLAGMIISVMSEQRFAGYLALIVAIALIPSTSKIGKLWKQYKQTGVYTPVMEPVKKKKTGKIVLSVILILLVIGAAGAGVYYFADGGKGSFVSGEWSGNTYTNEFMGLKLEVPQDGQWEIVDDDELEDYNDDVDDGGTFGQSEKADCMVQKNTLTGGNIMIIHLKGSISEDKAYDSIKENLQKGYQEQYGAVSMLIDSKDRYFAGQDYRFMKFKVTMMGASIYQEIYVKKIGKEICEIGITGYSEEELKEMEAFISKLD